MKIFYKAIEESMKLSPDYVKSIMKRDRWRRYNGKCTFKPSSKNNYLTDEEKATYLRKAENLLIKSYSEMYMNKDVYLLVSFWNGDGRFWILREENAVLNGIKIAESGNAYKHRVEANKISVSALSLINILQ